MTQNPAIVWFRQDLRLSDNPALIAAVQGGRPIIPIYIFDERGAGGWAMGAACRVWLYHSLKSLDQALGGHLLLERGDSESVLKTIAAKSGADAIYWNRCYEPWRLAIDKNVIAQFENSGVATEEMNGVLLVEPGDNCKPDGTPYKVFTAFKKKHYPPHREFDSRPAPRKIAYAEFTRGQPLDKQKLLPDGVRWDEGMMKYWEVGEDAAQEKFRKFLAHGLADYNEGRDRPDKSGVSNLSPHLHWGEISPRQVWRDTQAHMTMHGQETNGTRFLSELAWREFNYHLIYHFPTFPDEPFQPRFAGFKWRKDAKAMRAWQRGQTGYPIVDAGMRQLWQSGYMHNRVRMIVASFMIKDLLLHWRDGEKWFWDCLVDADLANNAGNWQWVAGCGADASPYFRIFNPTTQGKKFDPKGDYVRRWVPELGNLPPRYIHAPATAPQDVLAKAGVALGKDYPLPLVDHDAARLEALTRFKSLKRA